MARGSTYLCQRSSSGIPRNRADAPHTRSPDMSSYKVRLSETLLPKRSGTCDVSQLWTEDLSSTNTWTCLFKKRLGLSTPYVNTNLLNPFCDPKASIHTGFALMDSYSFEKAMLRWWFHRYKSSLPGGIPTEYTGHEDCWMKRLVSG